MSKEIRMPYVEYKALLTKNSILEETVKDFEKVEGTVILDYTKIGYAYNRWDDPYNSIRIPSIEGIKIPEGFEKYKKQFDEAIIRIEAADKLLTKKTREKRRKIEEYSSKIEEYEEKKHPWVVVSTVLTIILIIFFIYLRNVV